MNKKIRIFIAPTHIIPPDDWDNWDKNDQAKYCKLAVASGIDFQVISYGESGENLVNNKYECNCDTSNRLLSNTLAALQNNFRLFTENTELKRRLNEQDS